MSASAAILQAIERLERRHYTASVVGLNAWDVRSPANDVTRMSGADILALARKLALTDADSKRGGAPATAELAELLPGSSSATLPLIDLFAALEAHAASLPKPLPATHAIPVPATLPDRLEAPIDMVVAGRYQPRATFDQAELDELAESIREHGILNRLLVIANERGQLELVAGERRLRAARQIGMQFVPVEIRSFSLRQVAEISGIDNIQRAGLSAPEEGAYFNRLIRELKIAEAELARRLGKNRAYIQQRRAIASAAPDVLAALAKEEITFSQARAIAQAAPGQAKAQVQALTKVREWAQGGRRVTEADVRGATEKIVLAKAKKGLESLGWSVAESYGSLLIYSPGDRPRPWTGAEILEAVAAQRKPSPPAPAGATPSDEQMASLRARYRLVESCAPWVGLADGWEQPSGWFSTGELAERAESARTEIDALRARVTAAGWTLEIRPGAYSLFVFKLGGAAHIAQGWAEAEKTAAEIEAGKMQPTPTHASGYQCEQCHAQIAQYALVEACRLCADCAKLAHAAIAEREARIVADCRAILAPWLQAAPPDALRLVAAALHGATYSTEQRQKIAEACRAEDAAPLATAIVGAITRRACEYHDAPVYDAEAIPLAGQRRVLSEWTSAEAERYARQAGDAAHLLAAEGYADVAGAVQMLAGALASMPAPPKSSAADESPLARIERKLRGIAYDIAEHSERWDVEDFEAIRADMRQLRADLDRLSDAPDVSDAAYEELSRQIGEIEESIYGADS